MIDLILGSPAAQNSTYLRVKTAPEAKKIRILVFKTRISSGKTPPQAAKKMKIWRFKNSDF